MSKQLYLTDTYMYESSASIISVDHDDKGPYCLLDQTIFYPQGGGQPSDQGVIIGSNFQLGVKSVRQIGAEIRHYLNDPIQDTLNDNSVSCLINKNMRILNAKYHTAGHLLGNIVEMFYPALKAIKGHSFPKEAYVEFNGSVMPDINELQAALNQAISKGHATTVFEIDPLTFEQKYYKLPYQIPDNKVFRVMQIENYPPVPCGGTHLATIGEIGDMVLSKIKTKSGITRISYEVT